MDKQNLKELLHAEANNLFDEILSSLSTLNLLTTCTSDELNMTPQEMESEMEKEKNLTDKLFLMKAKIERWLKIIDEGIGNENNYTELVLKDCPWLKNHKSWIHTEAPIRL